MGKSFCKKNVAMMFSGVVGMGIALSFLLMVHYGTDTCSFMNHSLSRFFNLSLGTTMIITNVIFFIPELLWGRNLIGPGTIVNMTVTGYVCDFCLLLEKAFLPSAIFETYPWRPVVFAAALIFFLLSVSLYMNADLGLVPCDAVPVIISGKTSLPFFLVRIVWDSLVVGVGILAGGRLSVATVLLAFLLGPSVSWFRKKLWSRLQTAGGEE